MKSAVLTAMALMPRGIACRYTLSIFRRLVESSKKTPAAVAEKKTAVELATCAVYCFPVLLLNPSIDPVEAVSEVLFKAVSADNAALNIAISEVFVPVVCFLAGKYVKSRYALDVLFWNLLFHSYLRIRHGQQRLFRSLFASQFTVYLIYCTMPSIYSGPH